jgi:hypothetical protein
VLYSIPFWFAAGQKGNVGAFLGETVRRRFPNATIATGDNGHFTLQPSWHIASFLTWLPLGLLPNATRQALK